MSRKVVHIIYSGLGGHFDYVFNLIANEADPSLNHLIFIGVEPLAEIYAQTCQKYSIAYDYVAISGLGFRAAQKIGQILKKTQAGIIYVHSNAAILPALIYRRRNSVKLVFVEHHNNQLKTKKDWARSKRAHKHFDAVVYLNESSKNAAAKKLGSLFNAAKSVVIPTGIPDSFFASKNGESSSTTIKIGMQSRLVPIKDHTTLIRAFAQLKNQIPDCELHLAGDGTERRALENLVQELHQGDAVFFHGMLPKQELLEFLTSLDIYVHATKGETNSIALMEAMARNLPVIASDVTGINDFLTLDTAWLVPPGDVDSLTQAMERFCKDPNLRHQFAEKAFKFAQVNCALQQMVKAYKELESTLLRT